MAQTYDNILIKFEQKVRNGVFLEDQLSSIIDTSSLASFDMSAKTNRWATVVETGPDCEYIEPNMRVLVEHGQWTPGFEINGEMFWRTNEKSIMLISD